MNDFDNGFDNDAEESAIPESSTDGIFSIKVSEDMGIRNFLRSGLVEAQGKDTDKIPLFVSWPNWLDDGIVCMFARDLHALLAETVKTTAINLNREFEEANIGDESINDDSFKSLIEDAAERGDNYSSENFDEKNTGTGKSGFMHGKPQSTKAKIIKSGSSGK